MTLNQFAMIIVFLTFWIGDKFSKWNKNSLGGVKIHQVATSETAKCARANFWHLKSKFCVLVYLRLRYKWPWEDEQKYRLIFLLVFCGISLALQEFDNKVWTLSESIKWGLFFSTTFDSFKKINWRNESILLLGLLTLAFILSSCKERIT